MVKRFRSPIMSRFETHQFTIKAEERAKKSVAQLRGLVDDRLKDGLDVRRRARDHLEDRARCRQITVARFQLLEQPHILNGDDGLVGEGLEQRDLVVAESTGFATGHRDGPDRLILTKQRHYRLTSPATGPIG